MVELRDTCAIVTGASSGIGAATAQRLATLGARVVLAARRERELARIAARIERAGGQALCVPCDVTIRGENERLIGAAHATFGRVDVLVLNAGRGHAQSVADTREATLDELLRVNLYALYFGVQAVLPVMQRQGAGHIITIASMAGKIPMPYASAYVAAKHAAVGFSNALRLELLESGIHATVVCPASVATPWAASTAGVSMLDLARRASPEAKRIALERGITEVDNAVIAPRAVADAVVQALEDPVPEVYTHQGARQGLMAAALDMTNAERAATPLAIAMKRAYADLTGKA